MPGSPARSVREPGTRPPPKTLFTSSEDRESLGDLSAETCDSGCAAAAGVLDRAALRPLGPSTRTSARVFHSPQDGHLPAHLGLSLPQSSQT